MKNCPQCNYLMDAFDPVCPRCQVKGSKPAQSSSPTATPSKIEHLKKQALATESTPETVGGALKGTLFSLFPALFIMMVFAFQMVMNDPSAPVPPGGQRHEFTLFNYFMFLPMCALCGAIMGGWIGSGLLVQQTKKGAIIGAVSASILALVLSFCLRMGLNSIMGVAMVSIFLSVVFCGAYGSAERQRNGHGDQDGTLFAQIGVGIFAACIPLIGLFMTIFLNKSGSDKATAALGGTILGASVQGLMFVASIASHTSH